MKGFKSGVGMSNHWENKNRVEDNVHLSTQVIS
jgi:hypothetical protein